LQIGISDKQTRVSLDKWYGNVYVPRAGIRAGSNQARYLRGYRELEGWPPGWRLARGSTALQGTEERNRVRGLQASFAASYRRAADPQRASLVSPGDRRARAGILAALVAVAAAAMLALAGSASAAYIHPSENWGFGHDGTSSSEFSDESPG